MLIAIFYTVIEVLLQVVLVLFDMIADRIILGPVDFLVGGSIVLVIPILLLTSMDAGNLTELSVTNHAIAIVIASSEDGLNVLSPGEKAVFLEIVDQVWHLDGCMAFRDRIKNTNFDEILTTLKLPFSLSPRSLKRHLLVQKAREQ